MARFCQASGPSWSTIDNDKEWLSPEVLVLYFDVPLLRVNLDYDYGNAKNSVAHAQFSKCRSTSPVAVLFNNTSGREAGHTSLLWSSA